MVVHGIACRNRNGILIAVVMPSGWMIFAGTRPVNWRSIKQKGLEPISSKPLSIQRTTNYGRMWGGVTPVLKLQVGVVLQLLTV